jgi:hypothetical protein
MEHLTPSTLDISTPGGILKTLPQLLVTTFADDSLAYIEALSSRLLADPACRKMPDLLALGFWFRDAKLNKLQSKYQHLPYQLKPLGLVYHNTPANVDSLFMYPALLSLLCGNVNLIRLSSRAGASSEMLLSHICTLAAEYPSVKNRLQFIRAEHEDLNLIALMQHLDGRLLWGSDQAIISQRKLPVAAHCRDLIFNHKFSLALFKASALIDADDSELDTLVELFCRDNLIYAQQACASAKVLIWLGSTPQIVRAQKKFWSRLHHYIATRPQLTDSEQYQALVSTQELLLQSENYHNWRQGPIQRLQIHSLDNIMVKQHPGCGLFLELQINSIHSLALQLLPAHQTLTYWGLCPTELHDMKNLILRGLDRIVPLGQALEFSEVWDGGDLILQLCRLQKK